MTSNTPFLSIIIPAYNEGVVIESVLQEILQLNLDCEIIVIDDGSTDETTNIVKQFETVKLIRHAYNVGNGAAIKSGIQAASGEIIVMLDADGQHKPEDIPRLVNYISKQNYDMVVGSRTKASATELHRNVANQLYNRLASYIAGYKVQDLTSGFRAIRASIAKSFVGLLPNGFSYPTTLTIALFRSGYTVHYEPIEAQKRRSVSKIRLFADGVGFLFTILRIGVFFFPTRIFMPIAILFLVTGVGYGSYLLIFFRRFSNMATLLIITGMLTFMLGLISEQITLLRLMGTSHGQRPRN